MSSNKLNSNELIDSEAATTAADEAPLIDWWFSINNVVYLVEFRDNWPDDEDPKFLSLNEFCSFREAWTADFEAMCEALYGDANPLRHTSLESPGCEYGRCESPRTTVDQIEPTTSEPTSSDWRWWWWWGQ